MSGLLAMAGTSTVCASIRGEQSRSDVADAGTSLILAEGLDDGVAAICK